MRLLRIALAVGLLAVVPRTPSGQTRGQRPADDARESARLEDLAWTDAERHLTADAIVLLPLGAAAKEHGPHLKLRNDLTLANYLTERVMAASRVVVAPTFTYHFYPAFLEYPGSTSLSLATARDMTVEVVRSLARYGPRRFYVLNTGISTVRPLDAAANVIAAEGILLHYTNLEARIEHQRRAVQQQPGGTHADEIETSMMLFIEPKSVEMTKAVRDYVPAAPGIFRLTRTPTGAGTFSATGAWGDPTLATPEKGRVIVEGLIAGILGDLDALRKATLPVVSAAASPPAAAPPEPPRSGRVSVAPAEGCSAGDERAIRNLGPAFSVAWSNQDALTLAALWSREGDIVHPDGSVERASVTIRRNRAALFMRPEYKSSRHFLGIGQVRCLGSEIAVADGKWELRGVSDENRQELPPMNGLCTLVLKRSASGWAIDAYRYTVNPKKGGNPTTLKQPGFVK